MNLPFVLSADRLEVGAAEVLFVRDKGTRFVQIRTESSDRVVLRKARYAIGHRSELGLKMVDVQPVG